MSVFSIVKASVTALQVAQRYGLRVNSRGMACCPFHSDKSPSMKVDRRYYCFGCGVTGDAVDLASQLLGLSPREAALTVANDFGLHMPDKAISNRSKPKVPAKPKVDPQEEASEWIRKALRILLDYRDQLLDWKQKYAPASMDEEWHPLFCEALQKKSFIDYLLDELLDCSKAEFVDEMRFRHEEVMRIESRLEQLRKAESEYDLCDSSTDGKDGKGSDQTDKEQLPAGSDERSSSAESLPMEPNDRKNRCSKRPRLESR